MMASHSAISENVPMNQPGISSPLSASPTRLHLALTAWIIVILMAGLLPLRNFVGHPHWEYIQWTIPSSHWRSFRFYFDVVANVGLFYPLGLLLARRVPLAVRRRALFIIGTGLLLSAGIEWFQVYCHNRHPSPYDIMSNVTGTALGLWTATKVFSCHMLERLLPSPHNVTQ